MTRMSGNNTVVVFTAATIALVLTASPSFPPRPQQYHLVSELKNWSEARSYCRSNFVDLASIHSMDEQNKFHQLLQGWTSHDVRKVWTGMHMAEWAWSYPSPTRFRHWAPGRPLDSVQGPDCVLLSLAQGGWVDQVCSQLKSFICYDANSRGNHYIFEASHLPWSDAQTYCKSHYTNLASVRNLEENKQLMALLNSSAEQEAWIGLYRAVWGWADGSATSFHYFRSDEGYAMMENCAALNLDYGGRWVDDSCFTPYPFVCQTNGAHRLIVRMNVSLSLTSTNLTDPILQAAVMGQIKQRLESHGIPANTNVTWRYGAVHHLPPGGKPKIGLQ